MTRSILYEVHNLTLREGTGIATYARVLSHQMQQSGYRTIALAGINRSIARLPNALIETALNDAAEPSRSARDILEGIFGSVLADPLGVTPIDIDSLQVSRLLSGNLSGFDSAELVPFLFDRALRSFARYKRFLSVKLKDPPSIFHATQVTPLRVKGVPNVYTIHDIVPLRLPYATLDNKREFYNVAREICRTADLVVTVSEFSRQDIIRFFGVDENRIVNTFQAIDIPTEILAMRTDELASELETSFGVGLNEYYLFVGAIEPKKNLERLIDAYAASGCRYPLLIVGRLGWQYDAVVERIRSEQFLRYRILGSEILPDRKVRRLGYMPRSAILKLMKGARALMFPSLYEGFGLPVIEAMTLGVPVLTSNVTAMPEIVGNAAVLVDPEDVRQISAGIRSLDHDSDLRQTLSSRGVKRASKFGPESYKVRLNAMYDGLLS